MVLPGTAFQHPVDDGGHPAEPGDPLPGHHPRGHFGIEPTGRQEHQRVPGGGERNHDRQVGGGVEERDDAEIDLLPASVLTRDLTRRSSHRYRVEETGNHVAMAKGNPLGPRGGARCVEENGDLVLAAPLPVTGN